MENINIKRFLMDIEGLDFIVLIKDKAFLKIFLRNKEEIINVEKIYKKEDKDKVVILTDKN